MSPENLSRRAILAGAAAVPALALPAVVAAAIPAVAAAPNAAIALTATPDPVIVLAERAIEAWDAHGAACDECNPFEEAVFKWRKNNPPPASMKVERKPLDATAAAGLNEREQRIVRILRSGYEAAAEPDKAAMVRWRRRERAAEQRTGFAKADANRTAACDASWDAMWALRDTLPQTFAGLAAKARAVGHLKDDVANELEASLVHDIGVMAGEIDRQAVRS